MKKFITPCFALFLILSMTNQIYSQNVGINVTSPETELDVRSLGESLGSDLNLASPLNTFFLRLRSHTKTNVNPGIWWEAGRHLQFITGEEDGSSMAEFLRLDGKTIGVYNTGESVFLGENAGSSDDGTDNQNVAVGTSALFNTTSGAQNIAIGRSALWNNTTGTQNIAIGHQALSQSIDRLGQVAIGDSSLHSNTIGYDNVGIGFHTLKFNTEGHSNTALGKNALLLNEIGTENTALGRSSLVYNIDGSSNTAVGRNAMLSNVDGDDNTAVGRSALVTHSTGHSNTAVGRNAMVDHQSGSNNVALGRSALFKNISGSGNIGIGYQAGFDELGSNKLYIDNSSTASPLIYGDFASNLLRTNGKQEVTGDFEVHGNAFFVDQSLRRVGIGTTTPGVELHVKDGLNDAFTYALIEAGAGFDPVLALKNTSSGGGDDQWTLRMDGSVSDRFQIRFNSASRMVINTNGLVGLGTATLPLTDLHVKGTAFVTSLIHAETGFDPVLAFKNNTTSNVNDQWSLRMDGSDSNRFQWRYDNLSKMVLTTNGDMALGTTVPANGYKLSVNGKIIAQELRIQINGSWPDYVFHNDYNLMPLEELDLSIKKNGHLPGIPKGKEVEAEGFDSGEMQRKMMEKIEELTLYVIDLNKKNSALQIEVQKLKADNKK